MAQGKNQTHQTNEPPAQAPADGGFGQVTAWIAAAVLIAVVAAALFGVI